MRVPVCEENWLLSNGTRVSNIALIATFCLANKYKMWSSVKYSQILYKLLSNINISDSDYLISTFQTELQTLGSWRYAPQKPHVYLGIIAEIHASNGPYGHTGPVIEDVDM